MGNDNNALTVQKIGGMLKNIGVSNIYKPNTELINGLTQLYLNKKLIKMSQITTYLNFIGVPLAECLKYRNELLKMEMYINDRSYNTVDGILFSYENRLERDDVSEREKIKIQECKRDIAAREIKSREKMNNTNRVCDVANFAVLGFVALCGVAFVGSKKLF